MANKLRPGYYGGYSISRAYKRVTIWFFSKKTNARTSTLTIIPYADRESTKQMRYVEIAAQLKVAGLAIPAFDTKQ